MPGKYPTPLDSVMEEFWNFRFNDSEDFVETFDELPLWSAPFGILLLKYVDLKLNQIVLDIGSGTGFPLFELAERLGPSCHCFGLDPWTHATARAKKKIKNYRVNNVEVLEGSADKIPFENETVDLIVSNLGINNFENPENVFRECHRVLKSGGKIALTTNLNGHWKEFYTVFEETLLANSMNDLITKLIAHQEHRGTVSSISKLFNNAGFRITRTVEEKFEMRFLNGTAFFNHHFIQVGWLTTWQGIIPEKEWATFFPQLEKTLNQYAEKYGELKLTVPMTFIEGQK